MNEAKRNGQRVSLVKDKLYINDRVHVFGQDPVSEISEGEDRLENCIQTTSISLICICWNTNGGFSSKVEELSFKKFIFTYDLIMLTECLLEKDYDKQYNDFENFYFPRLKSRSVQ
jgi:hypothetical protein